MEMFDLSLLTCRRKTVSALIAYVCHILRDNLDVNVTPFIRSIFIDDGHFDLLADLDKCLSKLFLKVHSESYSTLRPTTVPRPYTVLYRRHTRHHVRGEGGIAQWTCTSC